MGAGAARSGPKRPQERTMLDAHSPPQAAPGPFALSEEQAAIRDMARGFA